MKSEFKGYYAPSSEQYTRLWSEGLIVLDTNVILNLYRLPTKSRDEFLAVLESLKERLWIPYQVALEFQRRRITVIASERKSTEEALAFAAKSVSDIRSKVSGLEMDNRGLGLQAEPLIKNLEDANNKLIEAVESVHKSQLDISATDPLRDKLDSIFDGRIGSAPSSQAELDALAEGGELRYKEEIPPGFEDAGKDKNPKEATFFHDNLRYERKFGDLILWRQLINFSIEKQIKSVILVTADKKDDWWWREHGKTIGPHPQLVREIQRLGPVNLFWMYSPDQFLKQAGHYTKATVSESSVAELQDVLASESFERGHTPDYRRFLTSTFLSEPSPRLLPAIMEAEKSVLRWLKRTSSVQIGRNFPDFITSDSTGRHGYEVVFAHNLAPSNSKWPTIIMKGAARISKGLLDSFSLVVVLPSDYDEILSAEHIFTRLERYFSVILKNQTSIDVIVGRIRDDGNFEPLWRHITVEARTDDEDEEEFRMYSDDP